MPTWKNHIWDLPFLFVRFFRLQDSLIRAAKNNYRIFQIKKDCPKGDVVGTCEIGKKKAEAARTVYFYSTGKKPHTAKSAEEACVGEFKPVAAPDASASATASAAASAAPPK